MAQSSGPAAQTDSLNLDSELWRFAYAFYSGRGVSPACLALQEALGIDVNFVLFGAYALVERGFLLSENDLGLIDNLVRAWRTEIVHDLRRLRTRLKTGPAPAPSSVTEPLRNRIKAAEIDAEQIELAVMADWLDRQPPRPAGGAADASSIPSTVARYFARDAKTFTPEVEAALDTLSAAIREAVTKKIQQSGDLREPMRAYMEKLKARGELLEVTREVDPKHELAAVTDAAHKRWGKPILFHNVRGTKLPVLTNTYGSRARLAEIIGIGPDDFCKQWNNLATIASAREMPTSFPATAAIN